MIAFSLAGSWCKSRSGEIISEKTIDEPGSVITPPKGQAPDAEQITRKGVAKAEMSRISIHDSESAAGSNRSTGDST